MPPGEQLGAAGREEAQPRAYRLGTCIFNDVYYSCCVSGRGLSSWQETRAAWPEDPSSLPQTCSHSPQKAHFLQEALPLLRHPRLRSHLALHPQAAQPRLVAARGEQAAVEMAPRIQHTTVAQRHRLLPPGTMPGPSPAF